MNNRRGRGRRRWWTGHWNRRRRLQLFQSHLGSTRPPCTHMPGASLSFTGSTCVRVTQTVKTWGRPSETVDLPQIQQLGWQCCKFTLLPGEGDVLQRLRSGSRSGTRASAMMSRAAETPVDMQEN